MVSNNQVEQQKARKLRLRVANIAKFTRPKRESIPINSPHNHPAPKIISKGNINATNREKIKLSATLGINTLTRIFSALPAGR